MIWKIIARPNKIIAPVVNYSVIAKNHSVAEQNYSVAEYNYSVAGQDYIAVGKNYIVSRNYIVVILEVGRGRWGKREGEV